MHISLLSVLLLSLPVLQACSQETPAPIQNPGNQGEVNGNEALARADEMMQSKDPDGAIILLSETLSRYSRLHTAVFSKLIGTYLAQDKITEARALYLQNAKQDQELARAGIDQIYSYYLQKGEGKALAEWTGQLLTLPLPEYLVIQAFAWHLKAVLAGGSPEDARELVKTIVQKFNPAARNAMFSPVISDLVKNKKYKDAFHLLDFIGNTAKGDKDLCSMVITERAKIMFLEGRWKDGEALIKKTASDLSDNDLAEIISFSFTIARNRDEFEGINRICLFILNSQKDKHAAGNMAASYSLKSMKELGKATEIPGRFEQLMALGTEPSRLLELYSDCFYFVAMTQTNKPSKQIMTFGGKLFNKLSDPEDRKKMVLLLMDGYFIIGDYARSLQTIDLNAKDFQTDWAESAKVKIGAHLAMQNHKYREAVECFRKYMDYIATAPDPLRDPVSGQIYTGDMLLGFNAMRIGNILRDNLKDEEGARKAYDEAEQYFKKSAAEVAPNSKEATYIDEQIALLASRRKKLN